MDPEFPERRTSRMGSSRPGAPRWVKIFGVVGAVIVVLVVILLVSGHGPSQHGLHSLSPSSGTPDTRQ